jgi:hypothetical protein
MKNNFSKAILLEFWCFYTKPNPNLNPKPGFFGKFSNPEPEPIPDLDF